ncbi:diaminohydroxyphosphoribosylaminopyrimidine deaminase/5-amino-6-(5-phosphoribosylamino)uracil reductase [Psychromicrobium silvestre]|uniref:Riboflavin biosynthesis protein RibD n=1 Tax=Psychromicrobium silvestre TaxID=1645614 RepID=A0A7Y9S6H6_9MICC|nr:bifunctional diaminohydroxyphosphoribosylaminopyrimidine deaminase/5-amino-6-(5-phosphoribosylamino)uracil reductase RibD [Psychromicrobium silvestre]NYE94102.1 diaminohydroxyphosphoribosylaminopyrimidine deaminase/5-amino-6-(5-phosphoribosylamino)uracil reductase [Psychromicrobium silvestre]
MSNELEAMQEALRAALGGVRGANPLVGAVVLSPAGEVLSVGRHDGAGTAHAEAAALAALAPGQARGATMVVTLEPCAHHGRTPACSQAILDAGISRVVHAVADPHGPAAGGAEHLRAAGVAVSQGLLAEQATELNRRWFAAVADNRPYTSVHIAQTLDGRIAAADGSSQWISSPESLAANHALRARVDAMLVGTGTVFADNPRLTARTPQGDLQARQPLRVVLGEREIPADAAIRADDNWLQVHGHDPLEAGRELRERGVEHLMVEGGAQVTAAFLSADLVDELIISVAPTILGAGISSIANLGIETLSQARHFRWDPAADVVRHGSDLTLTLIPEGKN